MMRIKTTRWAAFVLALGGFLRAAEVPRKAPELDINLPNGKHLLLSQFRGKVVVLTFISTT